MNRLFKMSVSLTFDDGLKAHAEIAARELEKRGWRGVFNVPTAFLDGEEVAEEDIATTLMPEIKGHFMNWDDARRLQAAGHEVYPHSQHHRHLDRLIRDGKWEEFKSEVDGSVETYVREMGTYPRFYCSPFHGNCHELREYLRSRKMMLLNCGRPNFGTNLPEQGEYDSAIPVLERKYREGRRHVDLMMHGITKADGGWMPFCDRKSFTGFLDELKELEQEGKIKVVSYSSYHFGYSAIWRLFAIREWFLNKVRRVCFRLFCR